jgi:hypothetical protein
MGRPHSMMRCSYVEIIKEEDDEPPPRPPADCIIHASHVAVKTSIPDADGIVSVIRESRVFNTYKNASGSSVPAFLKHSIIPYCTIPHSIRNRSNLSMDSFVLKWPGMRVFQNRSILRNCSHSCMYANLGASIQPYSGFAFSIASNQNGMETFQ